MNTNTAAIESLRTFAEANKEIRFAHLCTAALQGEEWAIERVRHAIRLADYTHSTDATVLRIIRSTDCTQPDDAIARGIEI